VESVPTRPVRELVDDDSLRAGARELPWGHFTHRLVAGLLLSGDVRPKQDGYPNRADLEKVGKRSNFHSGLAEQFATVFIAGRIIEVTRMNSYVPGPNVAALDDRDLVTMQVVFHQAFHRLMFENTRYKRRALAEVESAGFPAFLKAFLTAFRGLVISYETAGQVFAEFSDLPERDRAKLAGEDGSQPGGEWFDERGREAFMAALFSEPESSVPNFFQRCRECGFEIERWD